MAKNMRKCICDICAYINSKHMYNASSVSAGTIFVSFLWPQLDNR